MREVTSSERSMRWRLDDDAVVGGEGEVVIRVGGSKRERVECVE